jgi:hypothetical protein
VWSFSPRFRFAELRFGAEVAKDLACGRSGWPRYGDFNAKPLLPLDGATGDIFGSLAAAIK